MENTQQKKENKFKFKIISTICILLLVIILCVVLFFCFKPTDLFQVTEAKYESVEATQLLKYNYDETGRITSIQVDGNDHYVYTYSDDYKTVTIENINENTKRTVKFNDDFDVTEKIYSNGSNETFTYKNGKLVASKNTNGVTVAYKYKGKNVISEDYSNGDHVEYEYSGKRRLSEVITTASGDVNYTLYHYNEDKTLDMEDKIYDSVKYEYDSKKRMISKTNAVGVAMEFTYDEFDNITSISYPSPATMSYFYEKVDITKDAYKQNKALITYNDVIDDESVQLLR